MAKNNIGVQATGYRNATAKYLQIGPGVVWADLGDDTWTQLGATRGGNTFSVEPEFRDVEVDGARAPIRGLAYIQKKKATLKVNLLESTLLNLQLAMPGLGDDDAAATALLDSGALGSDTAGDFYALKDTEWTPLYLDSVSIVGQMAGEGGRPVCITLRNAAVKTGDSYEFPGGPAGESVIPVTFEGHLDQDSSTWATDGLFELVYDDDLAVGTVGYEPITTPVVDDYNS
jgi:hypothetical protein